MSVAVGQLPLEVLNERMSSGVLQMRNTHGTEQRSWLQRYRNMESTHHTPGKGKERAGQVGIAGDCLWQLRGKL